MSCTIDFLPDATVKYLAGKSTVALVVAFSGRHVFYGTLKGLCNPGFQFVKSSVVSNRDTSIK